MGLYTVGQLKSFTGDYLGFGLGVTFGDQTWDAKQTSDIAGSVDSGLNTFYHTAAYPELGIEANYAWSFLQPELTLTFAQGTKSVELPPDYAGHESRLAVQPVGLSNWRALAIGPLGAVEDREAMDATQPSTGYPVLAAIEPLRTTPQRFRLRYWPTTDQQYTAKMPYRINPLRDLSDLDVPYGGEQHAETYKAAVIAAAELYRDGTPGPRTAYFKERLLSSIAADRRMKPNLIGHMRDRSDGMEGWRNWPGRNPWDGQVSFDGVLY